MLFIQMSGVPGSGKSTLAKEISRVLDAVIIDHDVTKTALLEKLDGNLSNQLVGELSYHLDWALIESMFKQNKNIIFDSPCLYEEILERGNQLARKYQYQYKYVECLNDDYLEITNRLKRREAKLSQINQYASYDVFAKGVKGSKRPVDGNYLVVDSSLLLEDYLPKVMAYLEQNE